MGCVTFRSPGWPVFSEWLDYDWQPYIEEKSTQEKLEEVAESESYCTIGLREVVSLIAKRFREMEGK